MPKKIPTILEKIALSENRIKELIAARNKELLSIIEKHNAISIDDKLLAGFLIFALNKDNKDHPILAEFKSLSETSKIPSKQNKHHPNTTQKTN